MKRKDVVCIISTVTSESTFSISGMTLNTVRNSLNDESIEVLVCCSGLVVCFSYWYVFCLFLLSALTVLNVTLTIFLFVCVLCQKMMENLVIHYGPVITRHWVMVYVIVEHEIIYQCNSFYDFVSLLPYCLAALLFVTSFDCWLVGLLSC
jgi:hAT family C-terminal dimerisation region